MCSHRCAYVELSPFYLQNEVTVLLSTEIFKFTPNNKVTLYSTQFTTVLRTVRPLATAHTIRSARIGIVREPLVSLRKMHAN